MPTLYHYSPIAHLPPICREGLSKGDIAHPDLTHNKTAVSLTTQTDPVALACWAKPQPRKTAVRYTCRIQDGDLRLLPAVLTWRKNKVSPKAIRRNLDPYGQARYWYFFHGVITPDMFTVELRGRCGYVPASGTDLAQVLEEVSAARDRIEFVRPPDRPWELIGKLKKGYEPTPENTWIFSEIYPADRFMAAAA